MANHLRRQIRDAAVTALTGLATSASRVYAGRVYAMQDANLPGLRIFTGDQAVEQLGIVANPTEQSTLELVVECCAKSTSAVDDTLDQMAKEVQVAIAGNQTLGGAKRASLQSIEPSLEGEGEQELGVLKLTFEVLFQSAQNAPDVAT